MEALILEAPVALTMSLRFSWDLCGGVSNSQATIRGIAIYHCVYISCKLSLQLRHSLAWQDGVET